MDEGTTVAGIAQRASKMGGQRCVLKKPECVRPGSITRADTQGAVALSGLVTCMRTIDGLLPMLDHK